jgi:hypothetical protein
MSIPEFILKIHELSNLNNGRDLTARQKKRLEKNRTSQASEPT